MSERRRELRELRGSDTPGNASGKQNKKKTEELSDSDHTPSRTKEQKLKKNQENGQDNEKQPKIKDVLKPTADSPATAAAAAAPATGADIDKVLSKLDSIQKDNESIKTQLKEIKSTFQEKLEALDNRVSKISGTLEEEITENKKGLNELKTTVSEVESSLSFQGGQVESQKKELNEMWQKQKHFMAKIKEIEERENAMKSEINALKEKNLDMDRHNRKYNLLFYGIAEPPRENILETVKTFLKNDVKLQEDRIEQIIFANMHRIPKTGPGHKPIIVRFARWEDRELVMNQVFKGVLPTAKNIQTDLPPVLKEVRYNLQKEAYKLRTGAEKYRTRILEKGTKLKLQIRKDATQLWADYKA